MEGIGFDANMKFIGTPKIYTTTGLGPRKNREMAGVKFIGTPKIYTTPGVLRAPGVVYIESVVFYSSLHIHHQIVHTSHFPIFSRPKPGGGVYLWGPNFTPCMVVARFTSRLFSHVTSRPNFDARSK